MINNVLIVDDERDSCQNLSDILIDLGYLVDCAHDAPTALEMIREKTYQVALLDLKLPGMDGLSLYKEIKKLRPCTEAFLVTAYFGAAAAKEALSIGITEIVPKPIDVPRLLRVVERSLDKPLVLIVDDDKELCENLWSILKEQGCRVSVAHDAVQARESLENSSFNLVIIDLRLPGGDGASVYRRVVETNPNSRAMFMTGYPSESERLRNLTPSAADSILSKPLDVRNLIDKVGRLTDKSERTESDDPSGSDS